MVRRALRLSSIVVAFLATAAPTFAASAPEDNLARSTGSMLPFTGLDLGLFAGAAGVLLVIGLAVARLTRAEAPAD
jgi:hypothetical protein